MASVPPAFVHASHSWQLVQPRHPPLSPEHLDGAGGDAAGRNPEHGVRLSQHQAGSGSQLRTRTIGVMVDIREALLQGSEKHEVQRWEESWKIGRQVGMRLNTTMLCDLHYTEPRR